MAAQLNEQIAEKYTQEEKSAAKESLEYMEKLDKHLTQALAGRKSAAPSKAMARTAAKAFTGKSR